MTDTNGALSQQQQRFVRFYCTGLSASSAAQQAGYSKSYCRKASKLLRHPGIKTAIEESQASLRESQGYGQAQAVAELDRLIRGALSGKTPAHMAAAQLMGLKLKVFGLVRERIEVATVDLRGSLEQAKSRVIYINTLQPRQPCAELAPEADLAVTGGAHWTTRIPGKPLGD